MKKDRCPNCGGKTYWFSGNEEVDAHGYCPQCMDVAYDEMGQAIGELTPEWMPRGGIVMNKNVLVKNIYCAYNEEEIVHGIKMLATKMNQAFARAADLQLSVTGYVCPKGRNTRVEIIINKQMLNMGEGE